MSEGEFTVDNYQLLSCIARGTYSQVWEVKENEGSEHFAMKMLLPETLFDSDQIKMFKHEAKVGQACDHPNFVKVSKVTVNKKRGYLIMDYFRAPNLKTLIQIDLPAVQMRINKLFESICMALGYMHEKGWVHKDVKPDNILFSKGSELRLIDFSLSSRVVSGVGKLFAGKVRVIQGTRTYLAPETIRKQHAVPQTDMYSLGITVYEILTGAPPFRAVSPDDLLRKHVGETPPIPSEFNPNVTPEMDQLVHRMLAKKPAKRFSDMNELYAEFRTLSVFKEDVGELADQKKQAKKEEFEDGLAAELSSRADAERGGKNYKGAAKAKKKTPAAAKPAPKATQQKPTLQPPPPGYQPQPMPPPPGYQPQPVAYPQPMVYPPVPQPQHIPQPVQGMAAVPPQAPPMIQPVAQPQPASPPAPAKQTPAPPSPQPAADSKQQDDDDLPPMSIDDLIVS